jgi:hypothetical protein
VPGINAPLPVNLLPSSLPAAYRYPGDNRVGASLSVRSSGGAASELVQSVSSFVIFAARPLITGTASSALAIAACPGIVLHSSQQKSLQLSLPSDAKASRGHLCLSICRPAIVHLSATQILRRSGTRTLIQPSTYETISSAPNSSSKRHTNATLANHNKYVQMCHTYETPSNP